MVPEKHSRYYYYRYKNPSLVPVQPAVRCSIAGPFRRCHYCISSLLTFSIRFLFSDDDDLDRLLNNVHLVEPEPDLDGDNDNNSGVEPEPDPGDCNDNSSSVNASQILLFVTVGPPTEHPLGGTCLALDEGNKRKRRTEGSLCN